MVFGPTDIDIAPW